MNICNHTYEQNLEDESKEILKLNEFIQWEMMIEMILNDLQSSSASKQILLFCFKKSVNKLNKYLKNKCRKKKNKENDGI